MLNRWMRKVLTNLFAYVWMCSGYSTSSQAMSCQLPFVFVSTSTSGFGSDAKHPMSDISDQRWLTLANFCVALMIKEPPLEIIIISLRIMIKCRLECDICWGWKYAGVRRNLCQRIAWRKEVISEKMEWKQSKSLAVGKRSKNLLNFSVNEWFSVLFRLCRKKYLELSTLWSKKGWRQTRRISSTSTRSGRSGSQPGPSSSPRSTPR